MTDFTISYRGMNGTLFGKNTWVTVNFTEISGFNVSPFRSASGPNRSKMMNDLGGGTGIPISSKKDKYSANWFFLY